MNKIERDSKGRFVKGIIPWNKNIKIGTPYNKLFLDNKKIIDLYSKELVNVKKISKIFGCSVKPIYRILKDEHIYLDISDRRKKLFEAKKLNKPRGMLDMKRSNESKKKISDILKKKFNGGELIPHNKGKTKENYEPLRRASEINKKKWKDKRNHPRYGKKHRDDSKLKMSSSKKEYFKSKEGKNFRKKLSKLKKGKHYSSSTEFKKGEKHPYFNNWASLEPYDSNFQKKFKKFIKARDGCCLLCNVSLEDLKLLKRQIAIHHINYIKKMTIPQNCVTLCNFCHPKTNFNRKHWTKFFQSLLSERYCYQYGENQEIILGVRQ